MERCLLMPWQVMETSMLCHLKCFRKCPYQYYGNFFFNDNLYSCKVINISHLFTPVILRSPMWKIVDMVKYILEIYAHDQCKTLHMRCICDAKSECMTLWKLVRDLFWHTLHETWPNKKAFAADLFNFYLGCARTGLKYFT